MNLPSNDIISSDINEIIPRLECLSLPDISLKKPETSISPDLFFWLTNLIAETWEHLLDIKVQTFPTRGSKSQTNKDSLIKTKVGLIWDQILQKVNQDLTAIQVQPIEYSLSKCQKYVHGLKVYSRELVDKLKYSLVARRMAPLVKEMNDGSFIITAFNKYAFNRHLVNKGNGEGRREGKNYRGVGNRGNRWKGQGNLNGGRFDQDEIDLGQRDCNIPGENF